MVDGAHPGRRGRRRPPTVTTLANGLAQAQMTRVMAKIYMPKYSGNPEDLDDFERTWSKYVNDSTMGCSEGQRQRFRVFMLPHCVPTNVKKELDDWLEDGTISTWDEMWRAFRKKEVADLPHHARRRFKAVSLSTSGGHIRMADGRDFRWEYRHLRRYVEDWTEKSEAARVYDMLPHKWRRKVQTKEQKRGRWRTVVKILLPQQPHQGLLQWINSWATAHCGFDTMTNALMLSMGDRRMGESLKAMDEVKCTTGMLKVQAIDPRMTADEIIDLVSDKMTLQHRKEAQHQEPGSQRSWQPRNVRQTDADIAKTDYPTNQDKLKGSGSASHASEGKPLYPEVGVQAADAILAEV